MIRDCFIIMIIIMGLKKHKCYNWIFFLLCYVDILKCYHSKSNIYFNFTSDNDDVIKLLESNLYTNEIMNVYVV